MAISSNSRRRKRSCWSPQGWSVKNCHDWCQISKAIDCATGNFQIGALLAFGEQAALEFVLPHGRGLGALRVAVVQEPGHQVRAEVAIVAIGAVGSCAVRHPGPGVCLL